MGLSSHAKHCPYCASTKLIGLAHGNWRRSKTRCDSCRATFSVEYHPEVELQGPGSNPCNEIDLQGNPVLRPVDDFNPAPDGILINPIIRTGPDSVGAEPTFCAPMGFFR